MRVNNDMRELRQRALRWWNSDVDGEKAKYCQKYHRDRKYSSLTGREVEAIFIAECTCEYCKHLKDSHTGICPNCFRFPSLKPSVDSDTKLANDYFSSISFLRLYELAEHHFNKNPTELSADEITSIYVAERSKANDWWKSMGNKLKDELQRQYGLNKNYTSVTPDESLYLFEKERQNVKNLINAIPEDIKADNEREDREIDKLEEDLWNSPTGSPEVDPMVSILNLNEKLKQAVLILFPAINRIRRTYDNVEDLAGVESRKACDAAIKFIPQNLLDDMDLESLFT